jgi:hypothetical protein
MDSLVALGNTMAVAASASEGALGGGASMTAVVGYSEWLMQTFDTWGCFQKLGMHTQHHTYTAQCASHPAQPCCCGI